MLSVGCSLSRPRARPLLLSVAVVAAACRHDDTGGGQASEGSTGASAGSVGSTTGPTGSGSGSAGSTAGSTGGGSGTTATGSGGSGSSGGGSSGGGCDCVEDDCPPACVEPLGPEVGYVEIEPVDYTLLGAPDEDFTSSRARLWWGFQPARTAPQDAPVMVLFNGGPGAASEVIFGFNTSEQSADPAHNGGGSIGTSPSPWTEFANVLYIDARLTGYSYGIADADPANPATLAAEFTTRNFNSFIDAADFVRVLLRFLDAHPTLYRNEIVLVGESYGGARSTAMLDLLLRYTEHADGTAIYQDPTLVDEIQAHLDKAFPAGAGQPYTSGMVAQQFARQILVQPLLLGSRQLSATGDIFDQAGSVIFDIAADVGQTFVPCSMQGGGCDPYWNALGFVEQTAGRDRFAYPSAYGWLFGQIDSLIPKMSTLADAEALFGTGLEAVPWLYASERTWAYRYTSLAPFVPGGHPTSLAARWDPSLLEPAWRLDAGGARPADGDFPTTFGDLGAADTYYLSSQYAVLDQFYGSTASAHDIDPYSDVFGATFLHNLVDVETFLTNAAWDLVIWGPSIPPAIESFGALAASAVVDPAAPMGATRPGEITVSYATGAFGLGAGETRVVRFPSYDASHTVTLNQPVELRADVREWMGL